MAAIEELLTRAHSHVSVAGDELGRREGFDASAGAVRCRLTAGLLEECGATPSAELDVDGGDPTRLLLDAAEILDAIPAAERPARLGVARASLTGALLAVSADA